MSLAARIGAVPAFVRLRSKGEFQEAGKVSLRHWWKLDVATGWCEWRWREYGLKYRRRVIASEKQAWFEFDRAIDALAFRLVFG